MSKIITTRDKVIYNSLYNLQSYTEKSLQNWISKYKDILYPDYYCFLSGYVFKNKKGETSAADLILIAKDFSEWKIIEVELSAKQLTHTKYQLGVFTDVDIDYDAFLKHLYRKEGILNRIKPPALIKCIKSIPEVLVIFDYEVKDKLEELTSSFPDIKIGFCELYKTTKHDGTILRIYGQNNYITVDSIYLKPGPINKSVFSVSESKFFKKIRPSRISYISEGRLGFLDILKIGSNTIKVKIDDHAYNEDAILILERSMSNTFYLKALNA